MIGQNVDVHAEWHADCAYLIMWHADCIINFVFKFFKDTRGILLIFFKIKNNINEIILV